MKVAHHTKRGFIRDADIADLTCALAFREGFQCFKQGNNGGALIPAIAEFTETVRWTLRPVNLIQVEIVSLQALQAGIQCGANVFAIQYLVLADPAVIVACRTTDFRGDDQLFTVAAFCQPVTDVGFS